jgi:hypothetical protein
MSSTALLIALVALAITAVLTSLLGRRSRPKVQVRASTLSDRSYRDEKDGLSLLRMTKSPLDETVRAFLSSGGDGSDEPGKPPWPPLGPDDFQTLLHFSKRSAVLALRERDPARCAEGWRALAAVDVSRVNATDLREAAGVVDAVATSLAANQEAFENAIRAASPSAREVLSTLHLENAGVPLRDWGYRVADTQSGPALVQTEFDEYSPSTDLLLLAMRASELVVTDRRPHATFKIGTAVPPVWFRSHDPRVSQVLDASTGTALVSLSTREGEIDPQLFNIYFVEVASDEEARWLADAAAKDEPGVCASVAFAVRRVVCIAVTASRTSGKPSAESAASLSQALEPVKALLTSGHDETATGTEGISAMIR